MRKFISLLCYVTVLSVAGYGVGRLYFSLTDGFSMNKIQGDLAVSQEIEASPLFQPLNSILKQKFSYLGKGCQSYVFVSEDERYVLKFFKFQHLRLSPTWKKFAFLPTWEQYFNRKEGEKKEKKRLLFTGCTIAGETLPRETGVCFVHLEQTDTLQTSIKIIDKLGIEHLAPLDDYAFIIQKRAIPSAIVFRDLMEQKRTRELRESIQSLLGVMATRLQKGVFDRDPAVIQNIGFVGKEAIILDIGQLEILSQCSSEKLLQDFKGRCHTLENWFKKNAKEHTYLVQEEIHNSLQAFEAQCREHLPNHFHNRKEISTQPHCASSYQE